MSSGTERVTISASDYTKTLKRFVNGETLIVIPARRSTKLVAFAWLVERFEIGRRYTESEVNRALGAANADFATLRRGLYDEHFVDRADGMYWRTPDAARLLIT
jgi:hypothetical protein